LTALIGRCVVGAILGLLVAIAILWGRAALAGEAVPEAGRGMEAIARVFALIEHFYDGRIFLNETAEPPWSEAILLSHDGRTAAHLTRRLGTTCTYDLESAKVDREGAVDTSRPVLFRSIAFDRLSLETETKQEYIRYFYSFDVLGLPRAVCSLIAANIVVMTG
jgi:hypothetical protein